jgi:hypothetical protein
MLDNTYWMMHNQGNWFQMFALGVSAPHSFWHIERVSSVGKGLEVR